MGAHPDPSPSPPTSSRVTLIAVAIAVLILERYVPFGRYALYPFTLLATWVHEMGHGLTALAVRGGFDKLEIFRDASGLAWTSTSSRIAAGAVSAGGLLAPPLCGAVILALGRGPRRARLVLGVLALGLALSLPLWVRGAIGWIVLPPLAALVAAAAIRGGELGLLFARFVGVLLALDTASRIDYLFTGSAEIGGAARPSDVAEISRALGGPFLIWGGALAAISFALLALGLYAAWRSPSRRP